MTTHLDFMHKALEAAQYGRYSVSPNPMVGCVLVKNNKILGIGFHKRAGGPHAELEAIHDAGGYQQTKDATAYITLEPCCHYGRTPPCTQTLIKAGIKKIFIACLDPNPLVSGKGAKELRDAGIEIEIGLCAQEAIRLNEVFFHYIIHKKPFVIAKWSMSLDGKTITNIHDSRIISNQQSLIHSHYIRAQVDAILIGSNTAITDNPLLTHRLNMAEKKAYRQPTRIILSSSGQLPLDLKVFQSTSLSKTIIATTNLVSSYWIEAATNAGAEVVVLQHDEDHKVHLPSLLHELGKRSITSLLVEGGEKTRNNFFKAGLVNRVNTYLTPTIIANLEQKLQLNNFVFNQLGSDFYLSTTCKGEDQ